MRIGRWERDGVREDGFIEDAGVVPFPDALAVADVLAGGLSAVAGLRARAGDPIAPLGAVTLRAPLDPPSVRDFVAFEEHVEGVSAGVEGTSHVADEWYEAPTFYFTNPHTIRGPGEVIAPPETRRLDFELEVAAIVGGPGGGDLDPDEAGRALFGYTIMNDWSARDLQAREMRVRLGPCKGKDFAMSLGPWIVTADELDDFHDGDGFLAVRAEVFVNGELIGEDLVSNMGWPFRELVAYASRNSRIVPGDVLGSGTVGNGGCLGELWGRGSEVAPLVQGDEVRMVVEGIGELIGSVGEPVPHVELPRARVRSRARRR
ncbi:MAG: fumarylacetoacetate hydrolase family protein [Microbacterium gubbeenense]|uniref:fumarylacetoacetate hydrolase family protein n=1 Tax=Microbacterium gubbeenense TaxID=159896 RepID=UPI003F961DF1